MSNELNKFRLVAEPSAPCDATIVEVATKREDGQPFVSKFGNHRQALVVAHTEEGFEVRDYFDLPEDGNVRRGRLYDLMKSTEAETLANLIKKPPKWGMAMDQVRTMKEGIRVDGSKVERELGITYTPIRATLEEAIASYKE